MRILRGGAFVCLFFVFAALISPLVSADSLHVNPITGLLDLVGNGTGTVTSIATTSPITGGTITTTGTIACATCTVTIGSGTATLGTSPIASTACATTVTTTISGTASTDAVTWTANADISAVTGYAPVTTGGLTVYAWPTTNTVSFKVCNPTSSSITPGSAIAFNVRVTR